MLYTSINDFIEPKLKQIGSDVTALRNKGAARSRDDEKQFEALQSYEVELIELRDTLLNLAPTYKAQSERRRASKCRPSVAVVPPQTLAKGAQGHLGQALNEGDYDWAHLAMNYWPDRVREKCKTDKSLAIAHGLEDLCIEFEANPKKARGKRKAGG